MTAEATQPTAADAAAGARAAPPAREKTAIPKNPGRRDLGMKATLLFPNKEIVEQYYVPLIYTACRTCYSELTPGRHLRPGHRPAGSSRRRCRS